MVALRFARLCVRDRTRQTKEIKFDPFPPVSPSHGPRRRSVERLGLGPSPTLSSNSILLSHRFPIPHHPSTPHSPTLPHSDTYFSLLRFFFAHSHTSACFALAGLAHTMNRLARSRVQISDRMTNDNDDDESARTRQCVSVY